MRKLLILLIKFVPVMQMAGMLLNNVLYYMDFDRRISYMLDFITGNSIITTIVLYVCSYVFKFCIWHRLLITANFINLAIAMYDSIFHIPISDVQLLITYHVVAVIFIIISTIIHLKHRDVKQNKCDSQAS